MDFSCKQQQSFLTVSNSKYTVLQKLRYNIPDGGRSDRLKWDCHKPMLQQIVSMGTGFNNLAIYIFIYLVFLHVYSSNTAGFVCILLDLKCHRKSLDRPTSSVTNYKCLWWYLFGDYFHSICRLKKTYTNNYVIRCKRFNQVIKIRFK